MITWEAALREYQHYLSLERGIAQNSREAYLRDLARYRIYGEEQLGLASPVEVDPDDLQDFLAFLSEQCLLGPRSLARNISSLRSFYGYLYIDEQAESDPSALLEVPRFGRKLPDVLSVPEITALFSTFDPAIDHQLRNRAMLEVMYSSGLRVSELIGLERTSVYEEEGFLRILGKGAMLSTLVAKHAPDEVRGTALTIVNSIGFFITILSIQLVTILSGTILDRSLFVILAIGPLFGLLSLRNA